MNLQPLPPAADLMTQAVLRQALSAHRYLGELKGVSQSIPNQSILISSLPLLEAKDSSAIENIITTHDALYRGAVFNDYISDPASKEVQNYAEALRHGFRLIKQAGYFSLNHLLEIHSLIELNNAGFRKLPGTELINEATGETVYVPPQNHDHILDLLKNLEIFINDDSLSPLDPLVKMAVIHFQFESIHPFYDGNGRAGRIVNILYLALKGLLDLPVLYLSRYIIRNKADYYRLLQEVRDKGNWEDWLVFMLKGIEETALDTIRIVTGIRDLMALYKKQIRNNHKFYSQDLLNNLFKHPYTRIESLENDLKVTRKTAGKYLEELVSGGLLHKEKISGNNYYINMPLFGLFTGLKD